MDLYKRWVDIPRSRNRIENKEYAKKSLLECYRYPMYPCTGKVCAADVDSFSKVDKLDAQEVIFDQETDGAGKTCSPYNHNDV